MSVRRGHVGKEVDHFLSLECGGVNVGADTWAVPCCQNCSCVEQFGFAFLGQWENGKNPQRGTYDRNWDRIGIETGR
jgi:hypothetical protein